MGKSSLPGIPEGYVGRAEILAIHRKVFAKVLKVPNRLHGWPEPSWTNHPTQNGSPAFAGGEYHLPPERIENASKINTALIRAGIPGRNVATREIFFRERYVAASLRDQFGLGSHRLYWWDPNRQTHVAIPNQIFLSLPDDIFLHIMQNDCALQCCSQWAADSEWCMPDSLLEAFERELPREIYRWCSAHWTADLQERLLGWRLELPHQPVNALSQGAQKRTPPKKKPATKLELCIQEIPGILAALSQAAARNTS